MDHGATGHRAAAAGAPAGAPTAPLDVRLLTDCHQPFVGRDRNGLHYRLEMYSAQRFDTAGNPSGPLTQRCLALLQPGRCSWGKSHTTREMPAWWVRYASPLVVRNGTSQAKPGGQLESRGLEVPKEQDRITLVWHLDGRGRRLGLRYAASWLHGPPLLINNRHFYTGAQGGGHGHGHDALPLFRPYLAELPPEGFVREEEDLVMNLQFECGVLPRGVETATWEAYLHLGLSDLESGAPYQDVSLLFTKICGRPPSWLNSGFGDTDDMGHVAGALPPAILAFLLLLTATRGGRAWLRSGGCGCPRRRFGRGLAKAASPIGMVSEGGCLEILILLLGGIIPSVFHVYSLTKVYTTHELYHLLAHSWMSVMGIFALIAQRIPGLAHVGVLNAVIILVAIAFLFLTHSQKNLHSDTIHMIYAGITAFFGLCRFAALYEKSFAFLAGYFGMWASCTLLLSAEKGVITEIELKMDPPVTAMVGGICSAVACLGAILLGQWLGSGLADTEQACGDAGVPGDSGGGEEREDAGLLLEAETLGKQSFQLEICKAA